AVFVRFEIRDNQAFDHSLSGFRAAFAFAREKDEFLHAARFQMTQRCPGNLAQIGRRKFARLPRSHQEQLLRCKSLRKMNQDEFEGLRGDFAAGNQRAEPAIHRTMDLAGHSVEFVVAIEYVGNERVRFDRSVRPSFKLDLHVFLSLLFLSRGCVYRRRKRYMASLASFLASFWRSASRRSWNFLPFATASSHFAMPSRK